MDYIKNKISESRFDHSNSKYDSSYGLESVITEVDIEKQMTEYTSKQIIS